MAKCNCKICRNNLADTVNDLYISGVNQVFILEMLKNTHRLTVNKSVLTRHLESFELPEEFTGTEHKQVINSSNQISVDLNNLSLVDYDFDIQKPETVIEYIQKVHLAIYLKQLEIVAQEIIEYQMGTSEIPPTISINNLKKLFDILDRTTGIEVTINQQKAIQVVESLGFKLMNTLNEMN